MRVDRSGDLIAMWRGALETKDGTYVVAEDREARAELFDAEHSITKTREEWHEDGSFFHLAEKDRRKLHLRLLPEPYAGDLRNAPVVILMKNPSFGDHCYWEHEQADYRAAMIENIKQVFPPGKAPWFALRPEFSHTGGYRYFGAWFRELARELVTHEVTIQRAVEVIAKTVCVVQMTGYTSADPPSSCETLPSAKAARDWVTHELWPQVIKGEGNRSLLVMRDWRGWLEGVEDLKGLRKLPPKALEGLKQEARLTKVKDLTGVDLAQYNDLHIETVSPRTPSFKPGSPQGKIILRRAKKVLAQTKAAASGGASP